MVFWLCSEILEDSLLPVPFHVVPIIDHSLPDGIIYSISWRLRICKRFVTDEEVKVFYTTFRCQMSGLRWYGGACSGCLCCRASGCDGGREYAENSTTFSTMRMDYKAFGTYNEGSEFPANLRMDRSAHRR
jgi:hypothetical protein